MTVNNLINTLGLEVLTLPDGEKEITGGYVGDLLSWVMGKAEEGDAWITIMSNINVIAVASLRDVACVILAENSDVEKKTLEKADEENVNILRSELNSFELCVSLGKLLNK
ncbi:MAG: AraC family transcriptional regulator [Clostridiales bacterium]|nr:AraC family transcriptional regulator [Clostridiales bacterium]